MSDYPGDQSEPGENDSQAEGGEGRNGDDQERLSSHCEDLPGTVYTDNPFHSSSSLSPASLSSSLFPS